MRTLELKDITIRLLDTGLPMIIAKDYLGSSVKLKIRIDVKASLKYINELGYVFEYEGIKYKVPFDALNLKQKVIPVDEQLFMMHIKEKHKKEDFKYASTFEVAQALLFTRDLAAKLYEKGESLTYAELRFLGYDYDFMIDIAREGVDEDD